MRNVWALVWGGLAGNVFRVLLSFMLHPYRPTFRFAKSEMKELFVFGQWILFSGILLFLVTQGDQIIVGRTLGITALGFYQMACFIAYLPATEITNTLYQVSLPAYSRLQDDLQKLKYTFSGITKVALYLSVPMACGIFILADEMTALFFGEKWMPMVPSLKILTIAGLLRVVPATTRPLFQGIGRPEIDTIWQFVSLVILGIAIYPLSTSFGIAGASVALLASVFVRAVGTGWMAIRVTKSGMWNSIRTISAPFSASVLMSATVWGLKNMLIPRGFQSLLIMIGAGITFYVFFIFVLARRYDRNFFSSLRELVISQSLENLNLIKNITSRP
jgi:O-antigen/teichoic acid export membrane protein